MAAPKGGTRERILDAAEALFAARGYDGASTRDIVAASGDTIGSVNYHFGSKGQLLADIIARRWNVIADARREAYGAERARHGGPPPLDDLVAAVVIPYLERAMRGGPAWRNYAQIQVQVANSQQYYDQALAELSEPVAREILGWMRETLPDADPADLGYAYKFMIGAIVECSVEMDMDRITRITDGVCSSSDFDAIAPRLVRFIAGGVRAICGDPEK